MQADQAPAIEAVNLSKRFGRTWALANISFRLPHNSILLVAGKNGSGKTTLLRVLSTAIRPDGGSAHIRGIDLQDRERVRRLTALLTHQAYTYESLTAAENLSIFARLIGVHDEDGLLDQVGLSDHSSEPVAAFSAGMRKRLALARVLLQLRSPGVEVVFLDEPYAALDAEGVDLVDRLVTGLREQGKTVAVASHSLERSAGLATHAILLEAGRLVWTGAPSELRRRQAVVPEARI